MTVRPLRRTLLVAATTGVVLAVLGGTTSPTASAEPPAVHGPWADGSFVGPVTGGQSALHSPHAAEHLGRKFK